MTQADKLEALIVSLFQSAAFDPDTPVGDLFAELDLDPDSFGHVSSFADAGVLGDHGVDLRGGEVQAQLTVVLR